MRKSKCPPGKSAPMGPMACGLTLALLCLGLEPPLSRGEETPERDKKRLLKLSLDRLANLEIVTVSKNPEALRETPAAVAVIRGEDIRRTGTTSLVDSLRMVPGLHLARVDANKWALGVRGFTSRLSRAVLVLLDGRSVYTPLFAGVYWEVQDTLLEDVDRVEVVRGPGGALWGANAVNGVVSIITKSARDSQGFFATTGWGPQEARIAARYGGKAGDSLWYRIYGKYFDRQPERHLQVPEFDGWHMGQGGFRLDWQVGEGEDVTFQGDLYDGRSGQRTTFAMYEPPFSQTVTRDADLSGGNVLGRWRRRFTAGSELAVQGYYDRTERREAHFGEVRDTFDIDLQHRLRVPGRQQIAYGIGYRRSTGDTTGVPAVLFDPASRADDLFTAFAHDAIELRPGRLNLTLGGKFEHNDYSGFEAQPSARLLWTPSATNAFWAAVTRAVRTPSRVEHDLLVTTSLSPANPTFSRIFGDRAFESERVVAYEAGYRAQPLEKLLVDLAAFHNRYADLLSLETGTPFTELSPPPARLILPFTIGNGLRGTSTGFEVSAAATAASWWRVHAAYSFLDLDLKVKPGSTDTSQTAAEGASPRHHLALRSSMNLPGNLEADGMLRYVDELPTQKVGAYFGLDLRLAWQVDSSWTVSVTGRNLLQEHHAEFGGSTAGEIKRAVFMEVTWRR